MSCRTAYLFFFKKIISISPIHSDFWNNALVYLSKVAVMHFTVLSCCFTIPVYDNDKYLWNISQPAASVLHFMTMLHSGTPLSCAKYFISYGKNSCTSEQICWQRKSIVFLVLVFFLYFFYLSLSLFNVLLYKLSVSLPFCTFRALISETTPLWCSSVFFYFVACKKIECRYHIDVEEPLVVSLKF